MKFSQRLKSLRKEAKLSQEQLAEKLNVSRQAVTKWETEGGTPELENIKAIASLFQISIDELLMGNEPTQSSSDFLYKSTTMYDLDEIKHYDIKVCGSKELTLSSYDGEKLLVTLSSNTISEIDRFIKVKLDDTKNRLDIHSNLSKEITEASLKEHLHIIITLPKSYSNYIELEGITSHFIIKEVEVNHIEYQGKTNDITIKNATAHIELDTNNDVNIVCEHFEGNLDINQLSATSTLTVPADLSFQVKKRGKSNTVTYQKNGCHCEPFSDCSATTIIEFAGRNSELIIKAKE